MGFLTVTMATMRMVVLETVVTDSLRVTTATVYLELWFVII